MRLLALLAASLVASVGLLAGCAPGPAAPERQAPPAGTANAPPADTTRPPAFDAQELERALHRAVNQVRSERGRTSLAWSDSLRRLARSHSQDMARRGFFGHTTPGGVGPAERAERLGLPAARPLSDGRRIGIGENLFRTYRYDGYRDVYRRRENGARQRVRRVYDWKSRRVVAEETVESWLESPSHRRALLSRNYRRHGLGVAFTKERIYVTQNLF